MALPGLKVARKRRGMTQAETATAMGCHPQVLWKWENGKRNPRMQALKRLAEILGVTTDFLLYGPDGAERGVA